MREQRAKEFNELRVGDWVRTSYGLARVENVSDDGTYVFVSRFLRTGYGFNPTEEVCVPLTETEAYDELQKILKTNR